MFPAARKGDPLTHDTLVPCGAVSLPASGPCPPGMTGPVIIEGLPAAHVGCVAICTGVITGGIAHPPLPPSPPAPPNIIAKGSMTVLIHGMPAARWFTSVDVAICTTMIGLPALVATRTTLIGG
jgi:uncharacterized Zn-binding protein involved in type VI secretion